MILTKTYSFSYTLILLLLCATFSLIGPASAELTDVNEIIAIPSAYQLEPGEAFTVQINLVPGEPISGAQFGMSFEDSGYLVDSIDEGDFFTKHGISAFFRSFVKDFMEQFSFHF